MSLQKGLLARALSASIEDLRNAELAPVTVAVIDSGIDGSHPDLAGRVKKAKIFEAIEEGKVNTRDSDPTQNNDLNGHGTGVASIIARIAPNTSFVDVRVLGGSNRGAGDALIYGFEDAVFGEAKVLNMSLAASDKFVPRMNVICERAYRKGTVIVASRRNMPLQDEGYPAALIPCIGVDNSGKGPEESWQYYRQDHRIRRPRRRTFRWPPMAAATPAYRHQLRHADHAGFVARLLGAYPGLRPFEVKAVLKAMAKDEPAPA